MRKNTDGGRLVGETLTEVKPLADQAVLDEMLAQATTILNEQDDCIKKLGQLLIRGKDTLLASTYERLVAEVRRRRGDHFVELAIMVADGRLDMKLADCGIRRDVVHLLTPHTQERLLNEEIDIMYPDGTTGKKSFFDFNLAEKNQVINDKGLILKPKQQEVKPAKPRGEVTLEPQDIQFDSHAEKITFKGNGRTHTAADVHFLVERLHRRGELDDFMAALAEQKEALENEQLVAAP